MRAYSKTTPSIILTDPVLIFQSVHRGTFLANSALDRGFSCLSQGQNFSPMHMEIDFLLTTRRKIPDKGTVLRIRGHCE